MNEKYIGIGCKLCWKCGGSGIDFTKYFCNNRKYIDCTCIVCKGKGYTKELMDQRPVAKF